MDLTLTQGETLRIARVRRELTVREASALVGCSAKYLSMIESGKAPSIGLEIAFAIEREFAIPAESWITSANGEAA